LHSASTNLTKWICILVAAAKAVFPVTSRWDRRPRRALWPCDFHGATAAATRTAAKRIGAGAAGWSGRAATSARARPCAREPEGPGCLCGFALPESAQPRALGWCHSSTHQESDQICWACGARSAAVFSAEPFQGCFLLGELFFGSNVRWKVDVDDA